MRVRFGPRCGGVLLPCHSAGGSSESAGAVTKCQSMSGMPSKFGVVGVLVYAGRPCVCPGVACGDWNPGKVAGGHRCKLVLAKHVEASVSDDLEVSVAPCLAPLGGGVGDCEELLLPFEALFRSGDGGELPSCTCTDVRPGRECGGYLAAQERASMSSTNGHWCISTQGHR